MSSEEGKEGGDKESKEISEKVYDFDAIASELSTMSSEIHTFKNMMSDAITSFYKKSDGITDDVKKFHTCMNSKMSDIQTKLDARINKVNENRITNY